MSSDAEQGKDKSAQTGSRFSVRQILGVVVLVVFVVFLLENNHRVTVRLVVPEARTSLSLALLVAGLFGALGLLLVQRRHKHK